MARTAKVASIQLVIARFRLPLRKPLAARRRFCKLKSNSSHALKPALSMRPSGDIFLMAAASFLARAAPLPACSAHVLYAARTLRRKIAAPPLRSLRSFCICSFIMRSA